MAQQEDERVYLKMKLFQSKDYDSANMEEDAKKNVFSMATPHVLIRGHHDGVVSFDEESAPKLYFNQLGDKLGEMFSVGLEIRANNRAILQATENLLINEVINSAD